MIHHWSMYRLISTSLVSLLVVAVVLAAVGLIGYAPGAILFIALIAVASTATSTLVFASVFRHTAHLESSLITGLLIAFIVPPTLDVRDLVGAGVAGGLAGASKYLLVVRGRHFLNPAATGVTLAGFLGLTAGFWWVATPPLTPLILILGAIVAWRSGFARVAGVGLAVGAVAVLIRLLLSGEELASSVYLVATSYPLVFAMLFMLTEPLTMAPRARSQYLVATVAGLGIALPFSLQWGGVTLYSSPELALVVGNLIALVAVWGTRTTRSAGATVQSQRNLGHNTVAIEFALERPVRFRAGQWVELALPHRGADGRGQRRIFSVVSSPHASVAPSPTLKIATRVHQPGSSFKHALVEAPSGSQARITNVGGDFLLPTDSGAPLLLIAGGIGITPFVSQLADLSDRGEKRDIVLIDVRKDPADDFFPDVLAASGARVLVASSKDVGAILDAQVSDLSTRWCAVSGSPGFVRNMKRLLASKGVKKVATDSFLGY